MYNSEQMYINNLNELLYNPKAPLHLVFCQAKHVFSLQSVRNGTSDFLATSLGRLSNVLSANEEFMSCEVKCFIYDMVCFAVSKERKEKWTVRSDDDKKAFWQWREWFRRDDSALAEKLLLLHNDYKSREKKDINLNYLSVTDRESMTRARI